MSKIPTFNNFNNQELVQETYNLLEGKVSYEHLDEVLNDLPQSIKPNKKLIETIAPECQK